MSKNKPTRFNLLRFFVLILVATFLLSTISVNTNAFSFGICHLEGKVTDAITGGNLYNVRVELRFGSSLWDIDYTNSFGEYDVYTDLLFGDTWVTLRFIKTGYTTEQRSVRAKPNYDITVNEDLMPSTPIITRIIGRVGYDTGKPGKVAGDGFTITVKRHSTQQTLGSDDTDYWGNYDIQIDVSGSTQIDVYASHSYLDDLGFDNPYLLQSLTVSPGQTKTIYKTFSKYSSYDLENVNFHVYLKSEQFSFEFRIYYDLIIVFSLAHFTDPITCPPTDPDSEYLMYLEKLVVSYKNPENIPGIFNPRSAFSLAMYTDWPIFGGTKFRTCYNFQTIYPYYSYTHTINKYYGFTDGIYEFLFGEPEFLAGGTNDVTWEGYSLNWPIDWPSDLYGGHGFWFPGVYYM